LRAVKPELLALGAILLWSSLATLSVALAHVPPFLLTGLSLLGGSLIAFPLARMQFCAFKVPVRTLLLGIYGLFGYHFLLFVGLRYAPPVEANLINYLWPLGIVIMAPLFLPAFRLRPGHYVAAVLGFAGAAVAILGSTQTAATSAAFNIGYLCAFASAFVWSSYSLLTRRFGNFPSAAVGTCSLVSGLLSLVCHIAFETTVTLSRADWLLIGITALGPLGGAFYLWDAAMKRGDPRRIGVLAFVTPLLSTSMLMGYRGQPMQASVALAVVMIAGAAVLGHAASRK
jgi:drug/metabolite transporter (DMT)-like permease